jgi:heterodisulfide reductase subunit D
MEKMKEKAWICSLCPKLCRHVCPVAQVLESELDTPNGKALLAYILAKNNVEITPSMVTHLYNCTTCGICGTEKWCPIERIDMPAIIRAARADIVDAGKAPRKIVELENMMRENKNPYGMPRENRFSQIRVHVKDKKDSEVLYFVGCTAAYKRPEIPNAVVKILETGKIDYTIMGDEICCGKPLVDAGYIESAKDNANELVGAIERMHSNTIVASCPSCYYMLKTYYPKEFGIKLGIEIFHITEYLEQLLEKGKIKIAKPYDKKVIYHDPCYLGRHSGIYDVPRRIIGNINQINLVESFFSKDNAHCCGRGGDFRITAPDASLEIAKNRLKELLENEPDTIITTCPGCKDQFIDALEKMESSKKFKIEDLCEVIAYLL